MSTQQPKQREKTRVELVGHPSMEELQTLWGIVKDDPTTYGTFTDRFPTTWKDFYRMLSGPHSYCWLAVERGEIVGANWLHDWGNWGTPDSAWMACYRVPHARGAYGFVSAARLVHTAAKQLGVHHLFCASRHTNKLAYRMSDRLGYYRVALFPKWAYFEGALDDVWVYSLRPDDHTMLLVQALMRSASQVQLQEVG